MKIKKLIVLAFTIMTLTSVLAACGKAADPALPDESEPAGDVSAPIASPTRGLIDQNLVAADITSAQRNVVNVGINADLTDFYPWNDGNVGRNQALWGIYQTLVEFSDGEYYPCLLKSYEISEDELAIDCELFDYIHDSEGNRITVDDIIFSYGKATDLYKELADYIKEIVKTGEYSFTFNLNFPLRVAGLRDVLVSNVVSQKAFEDSKDEMHSTPVGTGPYKLTGRTSGYMFTYEKDDDYWQTDRTVLQPRGMANVDRINYYVIGEASQRSVALEQGTIDICGSVNTVDLNKFDGNDGKWLADVPDSLSLNLLPNFDKSSPCSDLNLRLAICYAISNQAILDSVYGGKGSVLFEHTPDWVSGYNKAWEQEDNYYHYDAKKAAEYLAKSDYSGETLTIICAADENSANTAQLIQNFLLQIGIETDVQSYEGNVFKQYIQEPSKWERVLKSYPSSAGFYVQTTHNTLSATRYLWGGTPGFAFDDKLQDLIVTGMTVATSTPDNIDALHRYIVDNCYIMGLVNPNSSIVVPDWLTGVTLSSRKTVIPGGCAYAE
jgi:ABC-type transport system substrate-binding protein